MRPSDLFALESLDPQSALPSDRLSCLPRLATPFHEEALPAWIVRCAETLQVTPQALLFEPYDMQVLRDRTWWRRPEPQLLQRLSARTGLGIAQLRAMTFSNWLPQPAVDELARRFHYIRIKVRRPLLATQRYALCPQCVATDAIPYLHKHWTLGWFAICPEHRCVLITGCKVCGRTNFMMPTFRVRTDLLKRRLCPRCTDCGAEYPWRPAHELTLALQSRLFSGRSTDSVSFPTLGTLSWATAVALIDLLLALVWLAAHPDLRPCLYGRIERDLSLPDRIGRESYDGLLLAAWLLDQWPGRLHEAMEELRVPALPWTVGRQALFTPDAERALRSVLDSEYVDAETLPLAAIE